MQRSEILHVWVSAIQVARSSFFCERFQHSEIGRYTCCVLRQGTSSLRDVLAATVTYFSSGHNQFYFLDFVIILVGKLKFEGYSFPTSACFCSLLLAQPSFPNDVAPFWLLDVVLFKCKRRLSFYLYVNISLYLFFPDCS